jgi:hypothetical protein
MEAAPKVQRLKRKVIPTSPDRDTKLREVHEHVNFYPHHATAAVPPICTNVLPVASDEVSDSESDASTVLYEGPHPDGEPGDLCSAAPVEHAVTEATDIEEFHRHRKIREITTLINTMMDVSQTTRRETQRDDDFRAGFAALVYEFNEKGETGSEIETPVGVSPPTG